MMQASANGTFDLAVIGAGPAGLSAASEAAGRGLKVLLVEETSRAGGKVLHREEESGAILAGAEQKAAAELFARYEEASRNIESLFDALVWGAGEDKELYLRTAAGPRTVRASAVILCPGALERVLPFPGWTMPGIFTVGGLNSLAKKGLLAGRKVLVAGSGPLLPVLAGNLSQTGAEVVAVVSGTSWSHLLSHAGGAFSRLGLSRLSQGLSLWRSFGLRTPVVSPAVIRRAARGGGQLEAETVRVDSDWRPVSDETRRFRADILAVSYGLVPSVELARQFGCETRWLEDAAYWSVVHNEDYETTIPGVYVAGDGAGISGYEAAMIEGRLAAFAACSGLGLEKRSGDIKFKQRLRSRLKPYEKFAGLLAAMSAPGRGYSDILTDDTVVCRCEEVTVADIKRACGNGAVDINDLKRRTRLGMGHCQARFCGLTANELLFKFTDLERDRRLFTPRLPVKPVTFRDLAE